MTKMQNTLEIQNAGRKDLPSFALELATEPYPQLCVGTLIVANNDAYGPF